MGTRLSLRAARQASLTAALGAGMAGCGAGHIEPPAPPAPAPQVALPGATRALPAELWAAETPRAVILGLHGFGDRAATTFAQAGPFWAAQGITLYAYDQRGFGRNPDRLDWPGAGALIEDVAAVAAALKARHPDLPLYVLGASMGGGVVLAAAGEGLLPVADGVVLLAPAVWGGDSLPLPYRASAWWAAQLFPDRRWTGDGVVVIRPTDNIEALRALIRDPYHFGAPSSREFLGLVRLMDRAVDAAPSVAQPALFLWGAQDEVVPERPIAAVAARIPAAKYTRVPTGWHMLLRDLEARRVHGLIADWVLNERAARDDPDAS
ncbi:MAG: alpha/beta fold hydrolase [Pseudomonadota bacterium]